MIQATSIAAYREMEEKGYLDSERKKVLCALEIFGRSTSAEVAKITGIERHHAASRLSDLYAEGLVNKFNKRKCTVCNKKCFEFTLESDL